MPSLIALAEQQASRYSRPSDTQAAADAIPVLVDDTYHLFHLATPHNTIHHPPRLRSSWHHLRSKDLLHWARDDAPALRPGKTPDAPDADGAWTGSAVQAPDGNMHIFYTGYNLSAGGKQVILHATSPDKHGSAFAQPLAPITIASPPAHEGRPLFEDIDFRDPYVFFNPAENRYWMLVATRLAAGPYWTRGCIALLTSADPSLDHWTAEPQPLYAPNDLFCPECPELFSLPNGNWYLVYSRFSSPNAGTVYKVGPSPRGPFRTPRAASGGRLDARRWYAAKSCPKAGDPSKRIYFGWVADRYHGDGKWLWGGDMGTPREVSANDDGTLRLEPSREALEAAFEKAAALDAGDAGGLPPVLELASEGQMSAHFLPVRHGTDPIDYLFQFNISAHDAASFGLLLRADEDMKGHRLRFDPTAPDRFDVVLLSDDPPLDDFWADQYKQYLPREVDGPEIARHNNIKIDGSVVVAVQANVLEVFVGGRSISYRLPKRSPSETGELHAKSNDETNGTLESARQETKELGIFVEDGAIKLTCVSLRLLERS
ncbi:beta-galactosidase [Diplodia corticola]|uniref:beta-fructofuranosidase n=1 Tax=Diplodia corticola TaxID=236234 RepID=A0A1J9SHN3_9PEZI|nr:beta-galactosidase [Diplodia corticola]OJD39887.1 beta-galactosidase [Diplodia corticola]